MLLFILLIVAQLHAGTADEIHTVLPKDAIPAIFDPEFVSAREGKLNKNAPIIGVSLGGEHRAYAMFLLNRHEIVNDVVGGQPIATTW